MGLAMEGTASLSHTPATVPRLRRQIATFSVAGIANTIVDFTVLNFCLVYFGLHVVAANLIATTVALSFSFVISRRWVFGGTARSMRHSLLLFVIATLFGIYVIQNIAILFLSHVFVWPAQLVSALIGTIGMHGVPDTIIAANTAKFIATFASAVWNFVLYRYVVFRP